MDKQTKLKSGPAISASLIAGILIVVVFFGGFFGWATYAPLESAAIAPGTVSVNGQRKTVQHFEGGIVSEILVREGEHVLAGSILIKLKDTKARAVLGLLGGRRMTARAVEARLRAERDNATAIVFPDDILGRRSNLQIDDILQNQTAIFNARRDSLAGQSAILRQRILENEEEIKGMKGQIRSETRQFALIKEEISGVQILYDKGLARKPRLLQLQRRSAQIDGSRNMRRAQVARARQKIGETKLRITELNTQRIKDIVEQLKTMQSEIRDLDARIIAAADVLARTAIRAPSTGRIVGLSVHTLGGVISAGTSLMNIIPENERLIIEARVEPKDIDVVELGQTVQIRLSAFNMRNTIPLSGTVVSISADRLIDERTGRDYYRAEVTLDNNTEDGDERKLLPGMEAEVLIVAGKKTLLQYLIEPVTRGFGRAFRES